MLSVTPGMITDAQCCFYSVIDNKYICMIHNADSVHAVHFIGASMLRCKVADPNLDECEVCE